MSLREIENCIKELKEVDQEIIRRETRLQVAEEALAELGFDSTEEALKEAENIKKKIDKKSKKFKADKDKFIKDYSEAIQGINDGTY